MHLLHSLRNLSENITERICRIGALSFCQYSERGALFSQILIIKITKIAQRPYNTYQGLTKIISKAYPDFANPSKKGGGEVIQILPIIRGGHPDSVNPQRGAP